MGHSLKHTHSHSKKGLFHCVHRTFPEVFVCVHACACMCTPHAGICFSLCYSPAKVCLYVFITVVARHEAEVCDFEKRLKEQVRFN
jgi:hypothetical protein